MDMFIFNLKDIEKLADKKGGGGKIVVLLYKQENVRMHTVCDKEEGTKDKFTVPRNSESISKVAF